MLEGMTCEKLARFFNNNLCDMPGNLEKFCGEDACIGFTEIQDFLKNIYSGYKEYLENGTSVREYMAAVETSCSVLFALACFCDTNNNLEHEIDKNDFLRLRKVDLSSVVSIFGKYGITICYFKGAEPVKYFKASNKIKVVFSEQCRHMPAAFAYIRRGFVTVRSEVEYTDVISMFGKLDVARLLSSKKKQKLNFNIMRADIMRCAGEKADIYKKLITRLHEFGYTHSCTYVSTNCENGPAWNILFLDENEQTCARVSITDDIVIVRVAIPKIYLRQTVLNRYSYTKSIRERIDNFCCIACGRCQRDGRDYMRFIDSVPCCFGAPAASEIVFALNDETEIDDVARILSSFTAPAEDALQSQSV